MKMNILKTVILLVALIALSPSVYSQSQTLKDMTATTAPASTDILYVVISPDGSAANRKVTVDNLFLSRTGNKNLTAYASLSAAVTAIGSSSLAIIEIPATTTVSASLTVTPNITLMPTGGGMISVSAAQTLTVNGPFIAPLRHVFTGPGVVRWGGQMTRVYPQWWGASLDGVADDTAEIQAAIDSFVETSSPHAAGEVHIAGAGLITASLEIENKAIKLTSSGWGISSENPKGGYLKWDGAAGSPMILIKNAWNAGVENIRLIGKSSAKPTAAIEYRQVTGAATPQNHSFARDVYIGSMFGFDSDNDVQFDAGILMTGEINGDSNLFTNIRIEKCTIGVDIQNPNASLTHFDNLKITACTTGFKCGTHIYGTNWNFGGNDVDIEVLTGRFLSIRGYNSEGSGQWAVVGVAGFLYIEAGGFEITNDIIASGYVIDGDQGAHIGLKDGYFTIGPGYDYDPLFKIRVKSPGGSSGFQYLSLENVRNIAENQIDVTGPASTNHRTIVRFIRPPGAPNDYGASATNFLTSTEPFNEKRFDIAGSFNVLGGPLKIKQLAAPTGLTLTKVGSGTGTTRSYRVSAITADGETLASSAVTIDGNATLDSTHYIELAWNPVIGATGYKVYGREGGTELLMGTRFAYDLHTLPAQSLVTSFKDDGSVTPSGALPLTNTTGLFKIINTDDGAGNAEFFQANYNTNVMILNSTNTGSGVPRPLKIDAPDLAFRISGIDKWGIFTDGMLYPATTNAINIGSASFQVLNTFSRNWVSGGVAHASLGSPSVGTSLYCTDCTEGSNPCTSGGSGTWAFRINSGTPKWKCL